MDGYQLVFDFQEGSALEPFTRIHKTEEGGLNSPRNTIASLAALLVAITGLLYFFFPSHQQASRDGEKSPGVNQGTPNITVVVPSSPGPAASVAPPSPPAQLHDQPTRPPPAPSDPLLREAGLNDFVGDWINRNRDRQTVSLLRLIRKGAGFLVVAWGPCPGSMRCEWGETGAEPRPVDVDASANRLVLKGIFGGAGGGKWFTIYKLDGDAVMIRINSDNDPRGTKDVLQRR